LDTCMAPRNVRRTGTNEFVICQSYQQSRPSKSDCNRPYTSCPHRSGLRNRTQRICSACQQDCATRRFVAYVILLLRSQQSPTA
jgi:hypothetical protein